MRYICFEIFTFKSSIGHQFEFVVHDFIFIAFYFMDQIRQAVFMHSRPTDSCVLELVWILVSQIPTRLNDTHKMIKNKSIREHDEILKPVEEK